MLGSSIHVTICLHVLLLLLLRHRARSNTHRFVAILPRVIIHEPDVLVFGLNWITLLLVFIYGQSLNLIIWGQVIRDRCNGSGLQLRVDAAVDEITRWQDWLLALAEISELLNSGRDCNILLLFLLLVHFLVYYLLVLWDWRHDSLVWWIQWTHTRQIFVSANLLLFKMLSNWLFGQLWLCFNSSVAVDKAHQARLVFILNLPSVCSCFVNSTSVVCSVTSFLFNYLIDDVLASAILIDSSYLLLYTYALIIFIDRLPESNLIW